ncbi:MAG: DUF86 domain-containing protein [Flavobacteriales bacterium]|nr:DUF86 domain-containing protein [Flavobacteriales bacterium]
MSKRFDKPLLIDMLQSTEKVLRYTEGMDEAAFKANQQTRDAVITTSRSSAKLASHISERTVQANTEVEWGKIICTRHRIVHDYDQIRDDIIWRVVSDYLPPLLEQLKKILASGVE